MNKKTLYEEKLCLLSVLFFMVSTSTIFIPILIYLNNPGEFSFTGFGLLNIIIPIALSLFIISIILFYGLARTNLVFHKIVAICFAISFLIWLEGNIVVWNYGLLDGRNIPWSEHVYKGIIDTCIWIGILVIALLKASYICKIAGKASLVFVLLQLIAVFYISYQHSTTDVPSFKKFEIDESTKFSFSKNKNVILLILDSFQSDIFQEIINESPDYKNIFTGFIYFRNALAGHPATETSVSAILTGKYYEGLYSFEKHNKMAYLSNSIPKVLVDNGFKVELYPAIKRSIYFDNSIVNNIHQKKSSTKNISFEIAFLYDVSLFRFMPHVIKKYIYNEQKWLLRQNPNLLSVFIYRKNSKEVEETKNNNVPWLRIFRDKDLQKLKDIKFINSAQFLATADTNQSTFKYYHFKLPHWPLVLNENFIFKKMEINRENYKRQAKASLRIVKILLEKLKEIKVYDNSLIFIAADHGAGSQKQVFKAQDGFHVADNSQVVKGAEKINALALLLVKPFFSEHKMRTSNAGVSLSDIRKTIFSELGIKKEIDGKSILDMNISDKRSRRYISYNIYDAEKDYYYGLREWKVSGPSWIEKSWKLTDRIFDTKEKKENYYKPISFISFGNKGNAGKFKIKGWGKSGEERTWTSGKVAEIYLPNVPKRSTYILFIQYDPYLIPDKITKQKVVIYVNNKKLGIKYIDRPGRYKIIIPKGLLKTELNILRFEMSDASSPAKLGFSKDERSLAIAFRRITVAEIKEVIDLRTLKKKGKVSSPFLLSKNDNQEFIITPSGKKIQIKPGALSGNVDIAEVRDNNIYFEGWSADLINAQPAEKIIYFSDEKYLHSEYCNGLRPDVTKFFGNETLQNSGFKTVFLSHNSSDIGNIRLRIFAISEENVASELFYQIEHRFD